MHEGCVVLVDDAAGADAALEAGALDVLIWPEEAPRLERALRVARERLQERMALHIYRSTFRDSPVWMELCDPEVEFVDASRGVEEQSGFAREEAIGTTPAGLFRTDTHGPAFFGALMDSVHRTGRGDSGFLGRHRDRRILLQDLAVRAVKWGSETVALVAFKRLAHQEPHRPLGSWIRRHTGGAWILATSDGTIIDRSEQVLPLLGQEVLERSLGEVGVAPDGEWPEPGGRLQIERRLDDAVFVLQFFATRITDIDVVLVKLVDVTLQRGDADRAAQLAHKLEEARDQAMAADRAKSAFLASMSHELRTPLNAIIGYAELLEEDADEDARADLVRIRSSGTHLLALVDQVLDLARIESGETPLVVDEHDLVAFVDELVELVSLRLHRAGLRLELRIPPGTARFDRTYVAQIVLNLLDNACKYATPGELTVAVSVDTNLRVAVHDSGPGLDERARNEVFQPFARQTADGDGFGLGLANCRRLSHVMGGHIWVEPNDRGGSSFILELPRNMESM